MVDLLLCHEQFIWLEATKYQNFKKHIAMTEQRSLPLHFLTAFLTPSAF